MAGTVREAYGEVSGRVWEATFSRLRLQSLFGGVFGSIFADSRRFWLSFGSLWAPFWHQKSDLFQGLHFSQFLDQFWEGPAAGADLIWGPSRGAESADSASAISLHTPCSPLRGGRRIYIEDACGGSSPPPQPLKNKAVSAAGEARDCEYQTDS
jgi:hypothetical protein